MGSGLGSAQLQVMAAFSDWDVGEQVEISTLRPRTGLLGTDLSQILRTLHKRGCIALHNAARDRLAVLPPAMKDRARFVSLTPRGQVYLASRHPTPVP